MNDITVPDALRDELPADLDLALAAITTYRELCDAHDVETAHRVDVDDYALVVIAAGYVADDGNCEVEYADAESAAEAAQDYVDGGVWDDVDSTSWIHVYAWRRGYVLDEDGDLVQLTIDREAHTIEIEPDEPECVDSDGHDWQSPYDVLGGIPENPGVWGNGGGVIIREVCAHCGRYRETDTWAQDPSTGEQGLTSVRYEDADEASERWADEQA